MTAKSKAARGLMPVRLVLQRPRLWIAAAVGVAVGCLLLAVEMRVAQRLLLGWDAGVATYLTLIVGIMVREDLDGLRHRANLEDEGRVAVLLLTAVSALASLGAIVVELAAAHGQSPSPVRIALGLSTIVLSWMFVHTIFALHYAHTYYTQGQKRGAKQGLVGGLDFPGDDDPEYWDFVYFSLVIGMTSQVSDVPVTSKDLRRVVAAHGVISFFFNAALIALTVNIAASAM